MKFDRLLVSGLDLIPCTKEDLIQLIPESFKKDRKIVIEAFPSKSDHIKSNYYLINKSKFQDIQQIKQKTYFFRDLVLYCHDNLVQYLGDYNQDLEINVQLLISEFNFSLKNSKTTIKIDCSVKNFLWIYNDDYHYFPKDEIKNYIIEFKDELNAILKIIRKFNSDNLIKLLLEEKVTLPVFEVLIKNLIITKSKKESIKDFRPVISVLNEIKNYFEKTHSSNLVNILQTFFILGMNSLDSKDEIVNPKKKLSLVRFIFENINLIEENLKILNL